MHSRVFDKSAPRRTHLLKGRGLNGEILDLRADVTTALSRLEGETVLDIQWWFDGAAPPSPGSSPGQYGICHTSGGTYAAGSVWYDDSRALVDVTKKGLVVSPRGNVAGTVVMDANGMYCLYNASAPYIWQAKGGSGGGTGDATSIQTVPVDPTAPALNQVLLYNGVGYIPTSLTMDMIGPAFAISSFSSAVASLEVGQTILSPAFTAAYSLPPDTAPNSVVLTDSDLSPAKDVTLPAPPVAFTSDVTFTKNTYGAAVVFTLTAKRGASTKTATSQMQWLQRVYWGVAPVPGAYDEAFIKSLASNQLSSSRARTFSVNAGPGQKIFYCYRVPYGDATFTVGGFSGGFFKAAASVSVTNAYGFIENYEIWESDNPNLGPTTVTVS